MKNPVFVFVGVAILVRIGANLDFLGERQGILGGKHALQFALGAGLSVPLQDGGEKRRQLMGVMPDYIEVVAVLVIPRMAAFNVVDFGLQRRFSGGVVRLHRHQLRVIRRIGGAGNGRTDALRHHGAGGHGVEQQADEQKNRTNKQKAFFMAHNKCSGLLCLFLDRLGGLAGLFCGVGGVSGALGGGVFLFDGLFLLPA